MSKLYECEKCGYSTTRKTNWERHLVSKIHLNGKVKYHCEKCNVDFSQKCHLTAHLKSNKCRGICPIVDKKKLKQTEGYLKGYTFKLNCKKTKLKTITDRIDNGRKVQGDEKLYDKLEKEIPKLQVKRKEHKLKYKNMFDKAIKNLLKPYFNPTWRAISMWYYNSQ